MKTQKSIKSLLALSIVIMGAASMFAQGQATNPIDENRLLIVPAIIELNEKLVTAYRIPLGKDKKATINLTLIERLKTFQTATGKTGKIPSVSLKIKVQNSKKNRK